MPHPMPAPATYPHTTGSHDANSFQVNMLCLVLAGASYKGSLLPARRQDFAPTHTLCWLLCVGVVSQAVSHARACKVQDQFGLTHHAPCHHFTAPNAPAIVSAHHTAYTAHDMQHALQDRGRTSCTAAVQTFGDGSIHVQALSNRVTSLFTSEERDDVLRMTPSLLLRVTHHACYQQALQMNVCIAGDHPIWSKQVAVIAVQQQCLANQASCTDTPRPLQSRLTRTDSTAVFCSP